MQIIQPLDLESGFRTFTFRKEHHLAITAKLHFPLMGGDPLLFSDAYQAMSELHEPFIDEGLPKVTPEFFAIGSAKSPNGQLVPALDVSCKLQDAVKSIHVTGDRYWLGGLTGTTKPIPFSEMPLSWKNAFGGKDFDQNPNGKGIDKVKTELGEDLVAMPNIEYSSQLLTGLKQRPTPAGFSPILIDHPIRSQYVGTYDENWLANDFPGYPKDFNFKGFNAALKDQHLNSKICANDQFEINNMHENHASIQGQLPDFKARAFLVKPFDELSDLTPSDLNEVTLDPDTVVFYPNQLFGSIIFRGTIKVEASDASDYQYLLCAYESKNTQNRDKDHYFQSLVGRLHPDLNMQYALTTKDLIPDDIPCGMARLTQQDVEPKQLLAEHIEKRMQETVSDKMSETSQEIEQLIVQAKDKGQDTSTLEQQLYNLHNPVKDEWQIKFEAITQKLAPMAEDGKTIDLHKIDFKAFDDLEKLSIEYADYQKQKAEQQLEDQISEALESNQEDVANSLQQALERFNAPAQLPRPSDLKATLKQLEDSNLLLNDDQKIDIASLKVKLEEGHELQVEGYRQSAHMMEMGTPPLESNLNGIREQAIKAINDQQSLAYMDLAGIDFSGMDLRGVDFSNCYLEQCNFHYCNLEQANLHKAIAVRCDFSHANLTQANLKQSNIGGCNFQHANLDSANSSECEFAKSDFTNARFLEETLVNESKFNRCILADATARKVELIHCALVDCTLNRADFSESNLSYISFNGSTIKDALFINSNLQYAKMNNANYMYSNFMQADLSKADVSKSNLYGCEFLGTIVNKTDLSRSNLDGSKLENWRPSKWQ